MSNRLRFARRRGACAVSDEAAGRRRLAGVTAPPPL